MAERKQGDALAARAGANPARVYDYLLGGKTNYAADRKAAKKLMKAKPDLIDNIRGSRAFLRRAVQLLAGTEGISQFLDIGTGIPGPAMDNTHEVAQRATPAAHVVYVDNDPIVLAHAHALLTSTPEGSVNYIQADLHSPASILEQAAGHLDFTKPVAVMLLGVLYMIEDDAGPWTIVGHLMNATTPGSYLVISHPASDIHAAEAARGARRYGQETGITQTNRTHDQVTRFFHGLDLIPPGVTQTNRWRPGPSDDTATELSNWGGVGQRIVT